MEEMHNAHSSLGALGEDIACTYLKRHGFTIQDRNVARKTGEIDVVALRNGVLHIVEVKAVQVRALAEVRAADAYNPAFNLHPRKLRRVSRTAAWYLGETGWAGEWQIDGVLVWICLRIRTAHVEYLPHIA